MKKRISIIMLLTISVLMTGCEELHKKPLAYIETNADDRQSETSETETKKKKETERMQFPLKELRKLVFRLLFSIVMVICITVELKN